MNSKQFFAILVVYVVGAAASIAWALALHPGSALWSAPGLLGLVLWTSFFGFCNAVGWVTYWSREHWMG